MTCFRIRCFCVASSISAEIWFETSLLMVQWSLAFLDSVNSIAHVVRSGSAAPVSIQTAVVEDRMGKNRQDEGSGPEYTHQAEDSAN